MNDKDCPQCFGTKQYYNGHKIVNCRLCTDGKVSEEIEEAFINEKIAIWQ